MSDDKKVDYATIVQIRALVAELIVPEGCTINPNIGPDHAAIEEQVRTYISLGTPLQDLIDAVNARRLRERYIKIDGIRYHKILGAEFHSWDGRYVRWFCEYLQPPGKEMAIVCRGTASLEEAIKRNQRAPENYGY